MQKDQSRDRLAFGAQPLERVLHHRDHGRRVHGQGIGAHEGNIQAHRLARLGQSRIVSRENHAIEPLGSQRRLGCPGQDRLARTKSHVLARYPFGAATRRYEAYSGHASQGFTQRAPSIGARLASALSRLDKGASLFTLKLGKKTAKALPQRGHRR